MTSASTVMPDRPTDQLPTSCGEPSRSYTQPSTPVVSGTNTATGKEDVIPHGGGLRAAGNGDTGQQTEELDDFGLPIRLHPRHLRQESYASGDTEVFHDVPEEIPANGKGDGDKEGPNKQEGPHTDFNGEEQKLQEHPVPKQTQITGNENGREEKAEDTRQEASAVLSAAVASHDNEHSSSRDIVASMTHEEPSSTVKELQDRYGRDPTEQPDTNVHHHATENHSSHTKDKHLRASEYSHQRLTEPHYSDSEDEDEESDDGWQDMPALGELDVYDDFGHLVAKGSKEEEDEEAVYRGLGGAGNGYTRVQLDEDAKSSTSLDEDTSYLFKEAQSNSIGLEEELRDATSQLQATKNLLTESQRIAYVGMVRLTIFRMTYELERMPSTKGSLKTVQKAVDSIKKWGQMVMARIYVHMDINPAEQIMIEQLAEHGVDPADLVRPLMQNARVKNPLAKDVSTPRESISSVNFPNPSANRSSLSTEADQASEPASPPPYEAHESEYVPEVHTQDHLPTSKNIDIDLRWTVLCDLFLVLIADSAYDARSRTLLARIGEIMEVSQLQICRFEKRVMDALEMQEATSTETWDESEHMEKRRKMALKKRCMIMGLATVGGGVVIGLSAGLLAPVIGAGLAAGFTTIGISGTGAFLGGAGGTALIASGATLTGGTIGLRASNRRTGAVRTFEYRPLHNNKRFNLIITVSGWMAGGVDDIRLPFSTVDPVVGDIYSILWEPEMLQSMGDTINILATEALTQGLQQVLGSTVLVALMASLQLPLILTKLSYLIDNPWNVSLTRANAAGLILADSLMDHNLGKRPVTLLGFSLGSRLIFSCLKELADKRAFGLVENVYLFGSPIVANKDEYMKARSVVSGTFVNGYARNDWILGYLFRATSGGIMRVAGLAPVEGIPRLENIDCTNLVDGHMDYRAAMPRLLREAGWEVLSDEFEEIQDPDPDNHGERQRELIREIDAARKEAELKPEKKRFGLFKRGKLAEKQGWETYDVNSELSNKRHRDSSDSNNTPGTVLFDIDAIRAELASEKIEIKQLESTLPPMKLDLDATPNRFPAEPSPSSAKQQKNTEVVSPTGKTTEPLGNRSLYDTPASAAGDEGIQMSFDTPVEPPQRSYSSSWLQRTPDPFSDPEPLRPALLSSLSTSSTVGGRTVTASPLGGMDLERNAWADEGKEDDIKMTFE